MTLTREKRKELRILLKDSIAQCERNLVEHGAVCVRMYRIAFPHDTHVKMLNVYEKQLDELKKQLKEM